MLLHANGSMPRHGAPLQELADAIVAFSFNRLSTFQADALAGLVAALGGWGHRPPRPWLDRACLECYARLVCAQALAWSAPYARLGCVHALAWSVSYARLGCAHAFVAGWVGFSHLLAFWASGVAMEGPAVHAGTFLKGCAFISLSVGGGSMCFGSGSPALVDAFGWASKSRTWLESAILARLGVKVKDWCDQHTHAVRRVERWLQMTIRALSTQYVRVPRYVNHAC